MENRHQYRRHFNLHQRLSWQGGDGGRGSHYGALLSSGYIVNQTQSDSAMLAIKACYLYIPALLIVASMLWIGRSTASTTSTSRSAPTLMPDVARRRISHQSPENHAL